MGLRLNVRLNDNKHKDIIDALDNIKDVSREVRRLLRIGIQADKGMYGHNIQMQPVVDPVETETNVIPFEAPVKKEKKERELSDEEFEKIQQSLLGSNFGFSNDFDEED